PICHSATERCIVAAIRRWRFPRTEGAVSIVTYPFSLLPRDGGAPPSSQGASRRVFDPVEKRVAAFSGRMAAVMQSLESGRKERALEQAIAWRTAEPGSALAYLALGEALRALGDRPQAARAFGSIIDLYPSRADLRRFAAGRLETLGEAGIALAVDSYEEAVRQRPDHPSGHRLLAYALLAAGKPERAFRALEAAHKRGFADRFLEARRVLGEDLELVAAAWASKASARRPEILRALAALGMRISDKPSLRFVLTWETDANDVDFHIHDGSGSHASYRAPRLPSGGALYADVTSGYGPECFAIPGVPKAYPYRLEAHYYNRGPMGYGMGKLDVIRHDGKGRIHHEVRPFVVMNSGAFVPLGAVTGPR
ncbi:MAG: hypothetical protein RBU30_12655, partial [Polyangia bacterium]|nr:hypothetical protein [Polyangia bacterium]